MVWALLASLVFYGEAPSLVVLIGAAAITVAGLLALSERRFQRNAKFDIPNEIV
jgi:drug/metabolite transporter (DMT)-like permease